MYRTVLYTHWKQSRWVLLLFAIAAFALPLLSVQGLGAPAPGIAGLRPYAAIHAAQGWLALPPLLAVAIGVTLALTAWNWDHQVSHVYALSLPVPRWKYAMLKMGGGVTLALVPAVAFWIGAHMAAATITLPTGLHAYPDELSVRFVAAILLTYAVLFAMAAGTVKTTLWVVAGVTLAFVLSGVLTPLLTSHFAVFNRSSALELIDRYLTAIPGPLHVFTGNWSLIDV
jgi:hypothetical protein